MRKNETFIGEAVSLGSNGEGVVQKDGYTFFVPYLIDGETAEIKVLKVKDNVGFGRVENILKSSPARVIPRCDVFEKCGGCQLQHLTYEKQIAFKRKLVSDCLKKIGNIDFPVDETVASDDEWAYRNKVQMPLGVDKEGKTVVGFFAERSHRIIPVRNCPIQPEWVEKLVEALVSYMEENGITAYEEEKRKGDIRHIVVRELDKKAIVTLVSTTEKLKNAQAFIEKLRGVFDEFTLVLNINKRDTNVVFGERFVPLYGTGVYEAEEFGIRYMADSNTFVQVNGSIREKLYRKAMQEIAGEGDEVVIDCYSGGGLLTAMIARRCKRAYGIEIVKEAVACADALKRKNGLEGKMINICGDVAEALPSIMEKEKGEKIKLILDPPRAGIARSVLKAILKAKIPKLVLISCNPSTLARDLGILTGSLVETERGELVKSDISIGEYAIESVVPFDMFPQTKHVESVVLMSRVEK